MMASAIERQLLRVPLQRLTAVSPCCRWGTSLQWPPSRTLTSTPPRREAQQPPRRDAESKSNANDGIASLLDSALDFEKGTPAAPTGRTSRFTSRNAQASNPPSRGAAAGPYRPRPGSSVDDLLRAMAGPSAPSRNAPRRQAGADTSAADISHMLSPTRPPTPARGASNLPPAVPEKTLPMKLNASVGRTVYVNRARGMDPARAFRALEMQCSRNSVRRDFMRQRFHERPGLKRKRLKSERWRRRFKENFRGVVKLVQKMKKQGW